MKIKEIKIVNQDESTEVADIGADAINVDYNNTTVKAELDKLNTDINTNKNNITNLQSQVSSLASESLAQLSEIVDARGGFDTLGERLEKTDDKISSNIKVHFIYRGTNKGDCSLIGKNILIDVGNETDASELISYLVTNHITKIDFIIISHYHSDHIGGVNATGLRAILESSELDCSNCVFYLPPNADYTKFIGTEKTTIQNSENTVKALIAEKNLSYIQPSNFQELVVDEFTKLKFLNCDTNNYDEYYNITVNDAGVEAGRTSYNNFSIVAELQHLSNKFLFTGDIEARAQELICPDMLSYDVLKVAHHGVNVKNYDGYFRKLTPKISVIMNTTATIKSRAPVNYFKNISELYTANESGNVIVNSDGKNVHAISTNGKYNEEVPSNKFFETNKISGINSLNAPLNLINEGDDLNDYKKPGTFFCKSLVGVQTLSNCPTTANFKLVVEQITDLERYLQTIICNSDHVEIYHRLYNSGGWTNWNLVGHQKTTKRLYSGLLETDETVNIPNIKDYTKFLIVPTGGATAILATLNHDSAGIRGVSGLPTSSSAMQLYGINLSIGSQNADGTYPVSLVNFNQFSINTSGRITSTSVSVWYIYGLV